MTCRIFNGRKRASKWTTNDADTPLARQAGWLVHLATSEAAVEIEGSAVLTWPALVRHLAELVTCRAISASLPIQLAATM